MTKTEAKWLAKQTGISSRGKFVLSCLLEVGHGNYVVWTAEQIAEMTNLSVSMVLAATGQLMVHGLLTFAEGIVHAVHPSQVDRWVYCHCFDYGVVVEKQA